MAIQIQLRNGTASAWTTANPILMVGEFGLESDTSQFKIGNGVLTWTALPYGGIAGPVGPAGAPGPIGPPGPQGPASYFGNIDGGAANSVYGGNAIVDGGNA